MKPCYRINSIIAISMLLWLFPLLCFSQTNAILFKNVNVVDVKNGSVVTSQNVLVEGNRITKISSKKINAKNAAVIEATGKYSKRTKIYYDEQISVTEMQKIHLIFPLTIYNTRTGFISADGQIQGSEINKI